MNVEEALSLVQERTGLPRGDAISLLVRADQSGDPLAKKIEGIEALTKRWGGPFGAFPHYKAEFASAALTPIVGAAGYVARGGERLGLLPGGTSQYIEKGIYPAVQQLPEQYPRSGLRVPERVPVFGGQAYGDVAASFAGGAIPFMAAEGAIAPFAEAGVARVLAPGAREAMLGGEVTKSAAEAAGRAVPTARALTAGLAGSGVGYLYNKDPFEAAVGGALGIASTAIHGVLSKPLEGLKSKVISDGLESLARFRHQSSQELLAEITKKLKRPPTVADLQSEMAQHPEVKPMDIHAAALEVLTPEEHESIFGLGAFPEQPQMFERRVSEGASPEPIRETEQGAVIAEQLKREAGAPFGVPSARARGYTPPQGMVAPPFGTGTGPIPLRPGETVAPIATAPVEGIEPQRPGETEKQYISRFFKEHLEGNQRAVEASRAKQIEDVKKPIEETHPAVVSKPSYEGVFGYPTEAEQQAGIQSLSPTSARTEVSVPEQARRAVAGAIEEAGKKLVESPERVNAKKTFRQRLLKGKVPVGLSIEDVSKEVGDELNKPENIAGGWDIDPELIFSDSELVKNFTGQAVRSGNARYLMDWGQQSQAFFFHRYPETNQWHNDFVESRSTFTKVHDTSLKGITEEWEKSKLTPDDFEDVARIVKSTTRLPDGKIIQTDKSPNEAVNKFAMTSRRVFDRLYHLMSGVHARSAAIMKSISLQHGLDLTDPKAWGSFVRRTEDLLRSDAPVAPRGQKAEWESARQIKAAEVETREKLLDTRNKDPEVVYDGGFFSLYPLENERALVENDMRQQQQALEMAQAHGLSDPVKEAYISNILHDRWQRLSELVKEEEEKASREAPMRGVVPRKMGVWSVAKNPKAAPLEFADRDVPEALRRYHNVWFTKMVNDHLYSTTRELLPKLHDEHMKFRVKQYLDTQRGVEQWHNDRWIDKTMEALGVTEKESQNKITGDLLKFMAATRVFFSGKFYMFHGVQTFSNGWHIVGDRALASAWADALAFGKTPSSAAAWREATVHGHIFQESGGMLLGEPEGAVMSKITAVARWQRVLNKMAMYTATTRAAREPGFLLKAKHMLPSYYVDPKVTSLSPNEVYKIGRAGVRDTMYDYGRASSPRLVSGSKVGKVVFQFHQYAFRYAEQLVNAMKYTKATGDKGPLMRIIASWAVTGGLPALGGISGGLATWPFIRRQVFKLTGKLLPENSGIGYGLQSVGMGFINPIDVNEHMNPFSAIGSPFQHPESVLGPTVSTVGQIIRDVAKDGLMSPQAARDLLRDLIPPAERLGEAATQLGAGGQAFSSTGKLIAERPSEYPIARAFNLQPNVQATYREARRILKEAYKRGDSDSIQAALNNFRENYLVLSPQEAQSIRRSAMKEQRGTAKARKWSETFK